MTWKRVAEAQAGVISAGQLVALGLSRAKVRGLVRGGALERASRGVYQLPGANQGWRTDVWKALLEAGSGALLCRRSAAALWVLDGVPTGAIDIAVPAERRPRQRKAVRISGLDEVATTVKDGFPVTSVARTLVDVGSVVDLDVVERSLECALRRRLVSLRDVEAALGRYRTQGSGALRQVLARRPLDAAPTESDAETLFVILARDAGLPVPRRQQRVILRGRAYRLDFAWPEMRLAVEIDGRAFHGSDQLDSDLHRQNQLVVDGWVILRFTWNQLLKSPSIVVRDFLGAYERRSVGIAWPVSGPSPLAGGQRLSRAQGVQ